MGAEQGNRGGSTIQIPKTDPAPFSDEVIARAKDAGKKLQIELRRLEKTGREKNREDLWNKEVTV